MIRNWIDLCEKYAGAFNTRGKTCEVFRNPSRKEFAACGSDIRGFLVGDDLLVWNAYEALHQEVRDHMKLDPDSISIEIYSGGFGEECDIQVTDNTERTKWFHNPDIRGEIVGHPVLSSMFSDIGVSYFDEAIYGPWDDLEDE